MSGGAQLTPDVAALILFGVFFMLMVLRVPVAFALGLACLPVLVIEPRLSPMVLFNTDVQVVQLVHPAGGAVLPADGQPDERRRHHRLDSSACRETMVGHFPGGARADQRAAVGLLRRHLGSSTADAASQGKIFIEAQVKEGYDLSFSIAITAVSAVLAVIIPPSILMIVWGGVLQCRSAPCTSRAIIPGLLLGLAQMATVHVYAKLRNYPTYPRATLKEFFTAAAIAVPALMTPFIIVGGILLRLVHRHRVRARRGALRGGAVDLLLPRDGPAPAWHALLDTGKLSAIALFCVGTASAFGWLLAYYQIPKALLAGRRRRGAWGIIGVGLLHRVRVSSSSAASSMRSRRSSSSARRSSRSPTRCTCIRSRFAIIGIVSLAFGLVTPPYGLCLMISCAIAKVRIDDTCSRTR